MQAYQYDTNLAHMLSNACIGELCQLHGIDVALWGPTVMPGVRLSEFSLLRKHLPAYVMVLMHPGTRVTRKSNSL